MDVNQLLGALMRNRFWILAAAIVPLLAVGWYLATQRMSQETEDGVVSIESSYTMVADLGRKEDPPNRHSEDGMNERIDALTDEVYEAWKHQYDQQAAILVWPDELPERFLEAVEEFRTIEHLAYPTPEDKELLKTLREHYRDYIKAELPKLAEIIGAKWSPGSGGMGGVDGGFGSFGGFGGGITAATAASSTAAEDEEEDYDVLWDPGDQASLQSSRFDWSTTSDKVPTTLEILYAQEDLWVLKALMNIIAKTNSDASGTYNATIKEVAAIKIGADAGRGGGSIGSSSAERFNMSFLGGVDDNEDSSAGGGGGGFGMTRRRGDPAHNRYVDNDYQPVKASDLREALDPETASTTIDRDTAYLVVAKRMPIRMNLVMDTRKLHSLITECGNSSLMVEVRQVRVNVGDGASGLGGLGAGDDPMSMMGVEQEIEEDDESSGFEALGGGPEMMSGGSAGADALAGMEIEEEAPVYEMPVEIYGMIYIYNPVDTDRLGIEDEPEPAAAETPVSAPVDQTDGTAAE